mgnify:CR=1 FL=1
MHPKRTPFWFDCEPPISFAALREEMTIDVAIVGGGTVGLHTAWFLSTLGLRIAVFEALQIGKQATGKSAGKITSQHGLRYAALIRYFGKENAELYASANQRAVNEIADLSLQIGTGHGLEPNPAYIYSRNDHEAEKLAEEAEAASSLGLPAYLITDASVLQADALSAVRFDHQYQIDP